MQSRPRSRILHRGMVIASSSRHAVAVRGGAEGIARPDPPPALCLQMIRHHLVVRLTAPRVPLRREPSGAT
jgi:hypothetical protein